MMGNVWLWYLQSTKHVSNHRLGYNTDMKTQTNSVLGSSDICFCQYWLPSNRRSTCLTTTFLCSLLVSCILRKSKQWEKTKAPSQKFSTPQFVSITTSHNCSFTMTNCSIGIFFRKEVSDQWVIAVYEVLEHGSCTLPTDSSQLWKRAIRHPLAAYSDKTHICNLSKHWAFTKIW